ncbi:MAG: hypothetical protein M3464_19075, partial [Chloroflexota bacterium]|nr:hypothetical protein [Chloroflexota bacterium]
TGHRATGAAGASAAGGGPERERSADEIAKDLGERLKPVAAAAEEVATKALDLSAKGLSRLVDKLERRRRDRDDTEPS